MSDDSRIGAIARSLGIGGLRRHILVCADQTTPKCSGREESRATWTHLKRRLLDTGLASATSGPSAAPGPPATVLRTKVDCLRICEQGPIAVVYPDGVWYRLVDEQAIDRIVDEHLVGGRVVEDLAFAYDPLGGAGSARGPNATRNG